MKFTARLVDFDRSHSGNLQTRFSVISAYTSMQLLQLHLGARMLDDLSVQYQTINQAFLEVHAYF